MHNFFIFLIISFNNTLEKHVREEVICVLENMLAHVRESVVYFGFLGQRRTDVS